jgi:PAS domain S-box-containing protein
VWFYTLIIPALGKEEVFGASFLSDGPLGLWLLRPTAFLGLEGLDTISHGVFWSFFFNVGLFVVVSLLSEQDADDRAQAAAFVGVAVEDKPASGAPAILSAPEIERLVHHSVGDEDAEAIVRELFGAKAPADLSVPELLEMRIRFERLLAASLGAAAARIIVEDHFTISKEEAQQLVTSFQRMQQSLRVTEEEVKRGERLLASVVESVDDCIFTADTTGRVVTMNPAGRRLLGYELFDVSRLAPDLLAATSGARRRHRGALEVGRGWSGQVTAAAAGRRPPTWLTALFDDRGQRIGTVGVLHDLTEQVETQRRLIHREKLASLGEMAAGVAHEIRNPLGGIKMATNLLSSPEVDGSPLSQEMARSILSGIGEIEGIINNLLDWTRDARLERNEYELARILDPVVEAAAGEGRARAVQVGYGRLERDVVAVVDGQKLRQVFTNVMKNAMEAIEPRRGAGRVTVDLFAEGDRAVVEVVDDGVGISPEDRDRIFLPFFTTKPSGTGLGMSIVKKIVDLHAGTSRSRARRVAARGFASHFRRWARPSRWLEALHEATAPAGRGRRGLSPAPASHAGAEGLRGGAGPQRGGGARVPQGRGRRRGAHRPPAARDGRRRAGAADQGGASGPGGGRHDRLRHHRVGGRGDAARGGGLPGETVRGRRAAAGDPAGHRVPGAEVGEPPDDPAQPGALHVRQHRGGQRGHAGGVRPAALGGGSGYHGAHPRRDRGGQGAPRALRALLGGPPGQGLRGRQLRCHPGRAVRVRAVRLPPGRLHRCHRAASRSLRAGGRRHAAPRRDRGDAARPAVEAPARSKRRR